jgi:hypothetical protein
MSSKSILSVGFLNDSGRSCVRLEVDLGASREDFPGPAVGPGVLVLEDPPPREKDGVCIVVGDGDRWLIPEPVCEDAE